MPRYILIDHDSGYIFGDTGDLDGPARDESPAEAARRLNESIGEHSCTYDEHGPRHHPTVGLGAGAYHVYQADIEAIPVVRDGQDQATIDEVERLGEKVAVVTPRHVEEQP